MGLPPSDPPSPTIRISVTRGTESGSSAAAAASEEDDKGFLATGVVPSVRTSAAAKGGLSYQLHSLRWWEALLRPKILAGIYYHCILS